MKVYNVYVEENSYTFEVFTVVANDATDCIEFIKKQLVDFQDYTKYGGYHVQLSEEEIEWINEENLKFICNTNDFEETQILDNDFYTD